MVQHFPLCLQRILNELRQALVEGADQLVEQSQRLLPEHRDHEQHLNVNFDDGLPNEGGAEELFEGDPEVAAGDASQVEEGVRNGRTEEDSDKAVLLEVVVDEYFGFVHEGLLLLRLQHVDLVDFGCSLEEFFLLFLVLFSFKLHFKKLFVSVCCFFGHKVGRQFAQSRPEAPQKAFQLHRQQNTEEPDRLVCFYVYV